MNKRSKTTLITNVILLLIFVFVAIVGFGIYKFCDNFYLIRYQFYSRNRKEIFKRKRRRRR